MSSVTDELISEWNEMMTYKIKESDLLQPTETFVTKALASLLGAMCIKDCYTLKMYSENKIEAQIAKAKFVNYIDDLYKVSDPKNSFIYFDLIQPTSKKTIHLLKVLYNYFCYYQMMKKNVLGRVAEKLDTRDKLMKSNKDLNIEKERSKMQQEMLESKIAGYIKEVPVLKSQLEEICLKIKQLSEEVDKQKHSIEITIVSNRDALKKIGELNNEIVDEEEVKNLMADKQKLEKDLKDIKERDSATQVRVLEYHKKKEELTEVIEELTKLIDFLDLETILKQKSNVEAVEKEYQELVEKIVKINEDLIGVKADFESQTEITNKKIASMQKEVKMHEKKLTTIHKENDTAKKNLGAHKNELQKERDILTIRKAELEQILMLGEQTVEFLRKGCVTQFI